MKFQFYDLLLTISGYEDYLWKDYIWGDYK